jgi:hypothetical protein
MNGRAASTALLLALGVFSWRTSPAARSVHQGATAATLTPAPPQQIGDVMRLARKALYGQVESPVRGLFLVTQEDLRRTERTYLSPSRVLFRTSWPTGDVLLQGIDAGTFVGKPPTQRDVTSVIRDFEIQLWQMSLGYVLDGLDPRLRLQYAGADKSRGGSHLVRASAPDGIEFELTLDRESYCPVQVAKKGGWTMVFEDVRPAGAATLPYLVRVLDYQGQPFMTWRVERYQLNPEWPTSGLPR